LRYPVDRDLSSVVYRPPFGLRSFVWCFLDIHTGNGELELKQVKTSQKLTSIGNQQKLDCEQSLFFFTRVVICVSRAFCSTDQEKRETARSLTKSDLKYLLAR